MRPFHFRLEKVLEYRRQLEDKAKMALARAQADYRRQQELVEDLKHQRVEAERQQGELEAPTPDEIWLWRMFRQRLDEDIRREMRGLQSLARVLQKARQEVVETSKERKLLEKLKEKQAKRHAYEQAIHEQKENDEAATLRYEQPDL